MACPTVDDLSADPAIRELLVHLKRIYNEAWTGKLELNIQNGQIQKVKRPETIIDRKHLK